ncbi:MAG TPA: rhodanese-like domain-containing protein [Alphaproteobacteria bacterium]|nr:rhodanese-like domain-containing protein [Alphaproteobacteria bacterium]
MNKTQKIALILGLTLFTISAVMAENALEGAQTPLQDSKKAEEFFAAELDFKTNPYGVNRMIEEKSKDIIIADVRSAEDYAKGHIPGAINIPYEKYNGFNGSETKFPGLSKEKINIVYCYKHLCNLAQKAAKVFASNGYPVKEMVGGFEEWESDKYSIEK